MPDIVFLHGNVAIGLCRKHENVGSMEYNSSCRTCYKLFEPSRLLYPVKHKDYETDDFINNQWKNLQRYIKKAYMITIFGYSAPVTDVAAKSLMQKAWQKNSLQNFAGIDIVDIKTKSELRKTWESFPSHSFSTNKRIEETYLFNHPRRSCEAFQMATLQQNPWPDNKYPRFKTLNELQDWITPLAAEEKADQRLSSCG